MGRLSNARLAIPLLVARTDRSLAQPPLLARARPGEAADRGGNPMKVFTLERAGAAPLTYTDKKRWLWLASLALPALPLGAIAATLATGSEWWLAAPLAFFYGLVPILDALVGEDTSNPPEELVAQLSADRFYRHLTWATVPL